MKHHEDTEQRTLIEWSRHRKVPRAPDVEPEATIHDYLFAVPNGGRRGKTEAARMVGLGTKKGVQDLILSLARGGYAGLYIEMKKRRDQFQRPSEAARAVSTEQRAWGERAQRAGYAWHVAYGWQEAAEIIRAYLAGTPTLAHHQQGNHACRRD